QRQEVQVRSGDRRQPDCAEHSGTGQDQADSMTSAVRSRHLLLTVNLMDALWGVHSKCECLRAGSNQLTPPTKCQTSSYSQAKAQQSNGGRLGNRSAHRSNIRQFCLTGLLRRLTSEADARSFGARLGCQAELPKLGDRRCSDADGATVGQSNCYVVD